MHRLQFPRPRERAFLLAGALLGSGLMLLGTGLPLPGGAAPVPTIAHRSLTSPAPTARVPPPSASLPAPGAALDRVQIPAIGVDAHVEPVGLSSDGAVGVPADAHDAAWYEFGPEPGEPGDAVLDGHLDWYSGPAVFWRLGELKPQDRVVVRYTNSDAIAFGVDSIQSVPYDRPPADLFSSQGPPRLTLITCAGSWEDGRYTRRLVVEAAELPAGHGPGSEHAQMI